MLQHPTNCSFWFEPVLASLQAPLQLHFVPRLPDLGTVGASRIDKILVQCAYNIAIVSYTSHIPPHGGRNVFGPCIIYICIYLSYCVSGSLVDSSDVVQSYCYV